MFVSIFSGLKMLIYGFSNVFFVFFLIIYFTSKRQMERAGGLLAWVLIEEKTDKYRDKERKNRFVCMSEKERE